ncbi:hypothetical protein DFH06DRAFT_1437439 [Mycena polygramma]|nr:hypothetical protein DFH06DRAFT_1437439 [Mycena polygramma]
MHRTWEIPEVVSLVFGHLDVDKDAEGLATLARTCRAFQDPALDVLWYHQNTLMNLLLCLPAGLWVRKSLDVSGRVLMNLSLSRNIVPSDWDLVRNYARRVKSLHLDNQSHDLRQPYVIPFRETLRSGRAPGDYLLPNLEKLEWDIMGTPTDFIDLFLGPKLSSISFTGYPAMLLPTLAKRYPHLAEIDLLSIDPATVDPPVNHEARSSLVRALTDVRSVKLGTLDSAAFMHLGQLSTLRSLQAAISSTTSFTDAGERTMFSSLRTAQIDVEDANAVQLTGLLRTWNDPPLRLFSASLDTYPSQTELEDLYSVLGSHISPDYLLLLNLQLLNSSPILQSPDTSRHPDHLFRHLFPFTNLVTLSIHVPSGFDLTDVTISAMASAWPNIHDLQLEADVQIHPAQGTLRGIQALAEQCPHLQHLELAIDATVIPAPRLAPAPRLVAQEALVLFNVGESRIDNVFAVARFLSSIFANVQKIVPTYLGLPADELYRDRWQEVEAMLPGLVELREEERQHGIHFARAL